MGNDLYRTMQLADGVWRIDEGGLSVMYLIEGDTQALAVDCGVGAGDYLGVIRSLTGKPVIPACTSGLVPCAGGRGQFKTLRISRPDSELLEHVGVSARRAYALRKAPSQASRFRFAKVGREPMTMFLRQGDVIELGGRVVEVYEAPGVTMGCLAFYLPREKLLFTGLAFGEVCDLYRRGGDTPKNLADSARRLGEAPWETAYDARGRELGRDLLKKIAACAEKAAAKPAGRLPLRDKTTLDGVTVICRADKRR